MKTIETMHFLQQIEGYQFYSFEQESKQDLKIGMPTKYLENMNFPDLYRSWGIDAVKNPYAKRKLKPREWKAFEKVFFQWLKQFPFLKEPLYSTPNLECNWELLNIKKWWKKDNKAYMSMLEEANVWHTDATYRIIQIEQWCELKQLAKMAIRGVPLVFFSGLGIVFYITDCLTVRIFAEDISKIEQTLLQYIDFQILH